MNDINKEDIKRHSKDIGDLYTRTEDNRVAIAEIRTGFEGMEKGFIRLEKKIDDQEIFYRGVVTDIKKHNEKTIQIMNEQSAGITKKVEKLNGKPQRNAEKIDEHETELHALGSNIKDLNDDLRPVKKDFDDRVKKAEKDEERRWYQAVEVRIGIILMVVMCGFKYIPEILKWLSDKL